MGKGAIKTISMKQNSNKKVPRLDNWYQQMTSYHIFLWTSNFLKQQVYYCDPTLQQYNISAILLETNGMESSIKSTQHTNILLYSINDHIIRK